MNEKEEEEELLNKIINSDKISFKKIFYNYHDSLFRFIFFKVNDEDLAKDITQETFLRVWKMRSKLESKKSFFSLIAKISSNICYDYFRHNDVKNRHEGEIIKIIEPNNNNPEKEFLAISLEDQINQIVNKHLPEKCKEIFVLSRIEQLSNPDIAIKLNISIRTVENQIYRAIKTLKKHLKNYL